MNRSLTRSVLCGLSVFIIVGGSAGLIAAIPVTIVVYRWLRRRPTPAQRRESRRVEADLPFAADLLASALRAGSPPDLAAGYAGRALGGPLGERLRRVERALRLGAPAEEAWSYLTAVDAGGVDASVVDGGVGAGGGAGVRSGLAAAPAGRVDGTTRIARAAVRSQHSGAALAGALMRVADDLRADRLIDADAAGRRAGVLIVLPLGLCFLPAFVLAGLVPVIVAVLGGVLNP